MLTKSAGINENVPAEEGHEA